MKGQSRITTKIVLLMAALLTGLSLAQYKKELKIRLYWDHGNPINNIDTTIKRLRVAGKSGYNGVKWSCPDFSILEKKMTSKSFMDKWAKIKAEAKKQGITPIPGHFNAYSGANEDRMLAEAAPIKGTPFKVSKGVARCVSDHNIGLQNGGFESFTANRPNGWKLQKLGPGATCFQDKVVKHSGTSSLKVTKIPGNARIMQMVTVKPYRAYRITAWFKTKNLTSVRGTQFEVYGEKGTSHWLLNRRWTGYDTPSNKGVFRTTMDWKKCVTDFASMNNSRVGIRFCFAKDGYGGGASLAGTLWMDDMVIEEVGLYETMRRRGCPIVVKSVDGSRTYTEGKDYRVDPKFNKFTNDDILYEGSLTIPTGSAIQNGQILKVDWYKFADCYLYHSSTNFCLPEAWATVQDNVNRIDELIGHKNAMILLYDEWRDAFFDDRCELYPRAKSAGDYMSAVLNQTAALCRRGNSGRMVIAENDMYDPYHNARNPYFTCVGGTADAWKGIDTSIIILNWNAPRMEESLGFFMGVDPMRKGIVNPQLLYVQGALEARQKIAVAKKLEAKGGRGIVGMIWNTWHKRWEHLPLAAQEFKKSGWWGEDTLEVGIRAHGSETSTASASRLTVRSNLGLCGVEYHLEVPGRIDLRVVDVRGRTVKQIAKGRQAAGSHRASLDTRGISTGVYFINLRVDGKAVHQTRHVAL